MVGRDLFQFALNPPESPTPVSVPQYNAPVMGPNPAQNIPTQGVKVGTPPPGTVGAHQQPQPPTYWTDDEKTLYLEGHAGYDAIDINARRRIAQAGWKKGIIAGAEGNLPWNYNFNMPSWGGMMNTLTQGPNWWTNFWDNVVGGFTGFPEYPQGEATTSMPWNPLPLYKQGLRPQSGGISAGAAGSWVNPFHWMKEGE